MVFSSRLNDLLYSDTATSRRLNEPVPAPSRSRRTLDEDSGIESATSNNLRNLSVRIPKGVLTCVTAVAGPGQEFVDGVPPAPATVGGRRAEVVVVDQHRVGRFNPATYAGVFALIQRVRRRQPGVAALFGFNAKGSCPKCKGRDFLGTSWRLPRRCAEADLPRPFHP